MWWKKCVFVLFSQCVYRFYLIENWIVYLYAINILFYAQRLCVLCTIVCGLPLCCYSEMYCMAITGNAIAIRALNFNLTVWCQMVQNVE